MSITEGTQPGNKTWTGAWTTAQTSASFTPEAGALLVAIVSGAGTAGTPTVAITDSLSGSWTQLRLANAQTGTEQAVSGVWCRDSPNASMTVSATGTGTGNGGQLTVRTLIGALAAASQPGATNSTQADPGTQQVSVAAGTGNKIYGGAVNWSTSTAMTVLANTTSIVAVVDSTNGDNWAAFKSTGDTAGTATYGYSTSTSGNICAVEIKASVAAATATPGAIVTPNTAVQRSYTW